jgi:hypothetical protein
MFKSQRSLPAARIVAFLVAALLITGTAWAEAPVQDLNGRWRTRVGEREYMLDLKVKEGEISGTVSLPDGESVSVVGGLLAGDELSFTTTEHGHVWEWNGVVTEEGFEGERQRNDGDVTESFVGTPLQ